jgi:hypothetical protein
MELTAQTQVPFPRELVYRTYRDRLPEVVPYLPNVSSIVVRQRTEREGRIDLLNIWTARADVPSMARKFLKPEMLAWTDDARWDPVGWICRWRIETQAFPGLVECAGTTAFREAGSQTEIRIDGKLVLHLEKAHVPRLLAGTVQPMIERIVISALRPNLLSTGEGVGRFLQAEAHRA